MLLTNPIGLDVIGLLELGVTPPGLLNPRAALSQEITLFLSVVTEVKVAETLFPLEDLVTSNLLIHIFKVSQVIL
jgi:hypothetical protein